MGPLRAYFSGSSSVSDYERPHVCGIDGAPGLVASGSQAAGQRRRGCAGLAQLQPPAARGAARDELFAENAPCETRQTLVHAQRLQETGRAQPRLKKAPKLRERGPMATIMTVSYTHLTLPTKA